MNSLTYCREYSWVSLSANEGTWPLLREDRNMAQCLIWSLGTCSSAPWGQTRQPGATGSCWQRSQCQLRGTLPLAAFQLNEPLEESYFSSLSGWKKAGFCFHAEPWKNICFLYKFAGLSSSLFYNKVGEWLVRDMGAGWVGLCWKSSSLVQCWWVDCLQYSGLGWKVFPRRGKKN